MPDYEAMSGADFSARSATIRRSGLTRRRRTR